MSNKYFNTYSSPSRRRSGMSSQVVRVVTAVMLFSLNQTGLCLFFSDDCADYCVSQMHMMIESIPPTNGSAWNFQQRSFNNKTPMIKPGDSTDPEADSISKMQGFFTTVCRSYETVEKCLEKCEDNNSNQLLLVRQTYAGLKLICKDHRKDFFSALPCLTRFEPAAMSKCNNEIQQSHLTTANFTEAIQNREFYSIRLKFRFLCRDLTAMINCMEPIVRVGCGDRSTNLMLHFIALEFSSFEQLYGRLAFNEPLPHHCRSLLTLSSGRNSPFTQQTYVMTYPQQSSALKSSSLSLILTLIFFLFGLF